MSLTALAYLLIYFSGLVGAIAIRPLLGLLTYFFAFYMHAPGRWWGTPLPSLRWSLLAAVFTLLAIFIKREERSGWLELRETKFILAFLCFLVIQSPWALSAELHKEYLAMFLKFTMLHFLIVATVKTERDLLLIIIANALGSAYFGWIAMSIHSGGRFEPAGIGSPALSGANLLAMHVASVMISVAFILLCRFGKKKFLLVIPIALIMNLVLLTQSRGALVGLAVAGMFALVFTPKKLRRGFYVYALIGVVGVASQLPSGLLERLAQIDPTNEEVTRDNSADSRVYIVNAQLEMLQQSPLLGHGHRGTLLLSPEYIPERFLTGPDDAKIRASHNLTMSLLVDHGLIGGSIYLALIVFCCLRVTVVKASLDSLEDGDKSLAILLLGLIVALVNLTVSGQFSNSKVLEIDIWLYALIPVTWRMLKNKVEQQAVRESTK